MTHWRKRILVSLLLLLALLLAGFGALQTAPGQAWLERRINALGVAQLEGLSGTLPFDIRLRRVTLRDAQGPYASLSGLHLAWRPFALVRRHIHIERLEADDITLLRLPVPQKTAPAPSSAFHLPILPRVTLEELHIATIHLAAAVSGQAEMFTLQGGGALPDLHLALRTLEGPPTTLDMNLHLAENAVAVNTKLTEAPGGLLLHLLRAPADAELRLHLEAASDAQGFVRVQAGEAHLKDASIILSGDYALNTKQAHLALQADAPDLALFSGLAGTALAGDARVTLHLSGPPEALAVTIEANETGASANDAAIPPAQLHAKALFNLSAAQGTFEASLASAYLGKPAQINVTGSSQDATLAFAPLTALWGDYQAEAKGTVELAARRFDMTLAAPLAALLPALHTTALDTRGTGTLQLHALGGFEAFHLSPHLMLNSSVLRAELAGGLDIDLPAHAATGELHGDVTREGQRFALHLPFAVDAQQATLRPANVKGDGVALSAEGVWHIPTRAGEGRLHLTAPDLAPLGRLLGQTLTGHADADATLDGKALRVTLHAGSLGAPGVTLAQAALQASIDDLGALSGITAALSLEGLAAGETRLEKMKSEATGSLAKRIELTLHGHGNMAGAPFSADAAGSLEGQTKHIAWLKRFEARYDTLRLALAAPARLAWEAESFLLSPLTLTALGGTVTAEGLLTPQRVKGALRAHHLHIAQLPAQFMTLTLSPGSALDAALTLSGSPSHPAAALGAQATLGSGEHHLAIVADATWQNGALALTAKASAEKTTLAATLAATAPWSLRPFAIGIGPATPLRGALTLDAMLDAVNNFLRGSGQQVSGHAAAHAALSGTLAHPAFSGTATLKDANYLQQDAGLCLKHIDAETRFTSDAATLTRLNAGHEGEGTVNGTASLLFSGPKTVAGQFDFHRYRLFCGTVANGTIEGGLHASGSSDAATLKGTLTFPDMHIELPGAANATTAIPHVKIVRLNPRVSRGTPQARISPPASPLTLAVNIHVPGRMFVRGRGLDAEFAGDLAVTGPATAPSVNGEFATKRGSFELLDRKLKLLTAILRFDGPIPPSPFLEVKAESTVNSTTIDVALTGPAATPALALTSTPPLPQDEVLSMLLFNRNLAALGPFQVAQLAQAAAQLSGATSGPGVLGRVQNLLGIDSLDVGTDASNDVSVGAGKYITDKIYVGVTQGAKPDSRAVTTEIEVYPHVSATTGVSADGKQNLGLQWKHDY